MIGRLVASTIVLLASVLPAPAQTILGSRFDFKEKPGYPESRRLKIKALEAATLESIVGDPSVYGAAIVIIINGGTPTTEIISLPAGTRWRGYSEAAGLGGAAWRYRESPTSRVTQVSSLKYS